MKNQSDKPEKLHPKDSKRKNIVPDEDDKKAVLKSEDKVYRKEEAGFKEPARQRENSEQPVHPVKKEPKI